MAKESDGLKDIDKRESFKILSFFLKNIENETEKQIIF
ncbi:hypothetical protein HMPREF1042_0449 [Streptococcus constellatus subsp. pharyngis SK1060 = CCUG 46377]|uniref:Uncharacterized protein n=1 Tax=Streptococcus constellatus subsp. pharyngis SK1060 = CCUG 46377 TaxID=1035184 RepID=F9P4Q1_STRCV|nr:hypothetical protein HMPREF1042_0449 [Streptococcus constellatus subsp. pharyngis SK1060 = CCUG 46377]